MLLTTQATKKLAVVAAAMLIAVFMTARADGQSVSPQKEQDQAQQNEIARRRDQEVLNSAHRLKDWFIFQVQHASDTLAELAGANEPFSKQMADLLTSEDGKRIARDPITFTILLDFYDHPVATAEEIKVKQKAIASILDGIKAETKEVDVGYLPLPATLQEATRLGLWADERAARLKAGKAAIATAIEKAPKIDDPSMAMTLAKAIEQCRAKQLQNIADLKIRGQQAADKEAKKIIIDAAYAATLEEARAQRDRLLEEKTTELAQMKADYEEKLLQARADAERKLVESQEKYKSVLAELDRRVKDAATSRAAEDTNADIKRKAVEAEAKKKEQIALIKSKEVQELLAPFFAKGYWQPEKASYDKEPISLSQLAAAGALKPTADGVERLMRVAENSSDKDRPRWAYGHFISHLTAEQRDQVTKAQKFIIEYGQLMVEQGLLSK